MTISVLSARKVLVEIALASDGADGAEPLAGVAVGATMGAVAFATIPC